MSEALAARPASELIAGSPQRWATDGALLFALAPLIGVASWAVEMVASHPIGIGLLLGLTPWFEIAGLSVFLAIAGAAGGLVLPHALELVRGRVPLWLIAPMVGAGAATLALGAGGLAVAVFGTEALLAQVAGFAIGAVVGLAWLPYTVASVLRGPTRAVVLFTAALGIPVVWQVVRALAIIAML